MSTLVQSTQKTKLSVKTQIFAALGAIVAAIILPQIFHAVGAVSGLGTALGETFCRGNGRGHQPRHQFSDNRDAAVGDAAVYGH